jgi:hypothetical protein
MKWLWMLFWEGPNHALDWDDNKGNVDHAKAVADIIVFAFTTILAIVALRTSTFPPLGWGIALIAGAFGSRMFMAFLRSKQP